MSSTEEQITKLLRGYRWHIRGGRSGSDKKLTTEEVKKQLLNLIIDERIDEASSIPEHTYGINNADKSYTKGWKVGAGRMNAETRRYKEKRIKELESSKEGQ